MVTMEAFCCYRSHCCNIRFLNLFSEISLFSHLCFTDISFEELLGQCKPSFSFNHHHLLYEGTTKNFHFFETGVNPACWLPSTTIIALLGKGSVQDQTCSYLGDIILQKQRRIAKLHPAENCATVFFEFF